jgi:hypothetical protein
MQQEQKHKPFPKHRPHTALALLFALCLADASAAEVEFPAPNWSETAAGTAVAEADMVPVLGPLFERARRGEDAELLGELKSLAANDELSLPARERALYEFAQGLAELTPGAVGPEVIDFLADYQPRTLVPHTDNARVGTPLFNVRAATAGSLNAWQRQAGYEAAVALFAQADDHSASRYLEDLEHASPPRRQGLLDALPSAPESLLSAIAGQASSASGRGELNVAAARSALLLGDTGSFTRILAAGRGPDLALLLRDAGARLDEPARIELLFELLQSATPSNAALAIGTLAPGLLHRPEIAARMAVLVADPHLGAAAALAMARSDSADTRARLRALAAGEGTTAQRAALALDLGGSRQGGLK